MKKKKTNQHVSDFHRQSDEEIRTAAVSQRMLIILFSIVALVLSISGYFFYRKEVQTIRSQKHNELKTIAELKVNQISSWRNERIGDARLNSSAPFVRSTMRGLSPTAALAAFPPKNAHDCA